jgi:hypothetical protein
MQVSFLQVGIEVRFFCCPAKNKPLSVRLSAANVFWRQSDELIKRLLIKISGVVWMVQTKVQTSLLIMSSQSCIGKYPAAMFKAEGTYNKD